MDTIIYRNQEIKIFNDSSYDWNPRTECDNLGTMICFHRNYILGDKCSDRWSASDLKDYIEDKKNDKVYLPIFAYEHGGITIRTGAFDCPWDSGQVGYIFVTREKILNWYQAKRLTQSIRVKALRTLNHEIIHQDQWLTGDIWRYEIEDGDSCGGYFGSDHDDSGLLADAKSDIDWDIKNQREKRADILKKYIKEKVPIQYRTKLINH